MTLTHGSRNQFPSQLLAFTYSIHPAKVPISPSPAKPLSPCRASEHPRRVGTIEDLTQKARETITTDIVRIVQITQMIEIGDIDTMMLKSGAAGIERVEPPRGMVVRASKGVVLITNASDLTTAKRRMRSGEGAREKRSESW